MARSARRATLRYTQREEEGDLMRKLALGIAAVTVVVVSGSVATGEAVTYGLRNAWERGTLFIEPGTQVYEGMIVGEHARGDDLDVNVCKTKVLSAMRTRASDHDTSRLPPIRQLSLDDCIEFVNEDELVEVTPENIRLRKKVLLRDDRAKAASLRAKALAAG
jgi:GTP-binding protein